MIYGINGLCYRGHFYTKTLACLQPNNLTSGFLFFGFLFVFFSGGGACSILGIIKFMWTAKLEIFSRTTLSRKFNLTKVRPLFTLWHRGSDNYPLLIVFKWTLYELSLCLYNVMISTNQIPYSFSLLSVALHHDFNQSLNAVYYFWRWRNRLAYFQSHKSNDWLVNIIRT